MSRFEYNKLDMSVISESFRQDGVVEFIFDRFESRFVDYKLKQIFFREKEVSEVTAMDGFVLIFQFLYIIPTLIFIFFKRPKMVVFTDFIKNNKVIFFNKNIENKYFVYRLSIKK